ncbi:MAG: hypothetical protein LBF76_01445 [Holosporales bacterium]|nr:hypothetical protein [Holosporales bacterium]
MPVFIDQREVSDLLQVYYRIRNAQVRLHFWDLLKSFGNAKKETANSALE